MFTVQRTVQDKNVPNPNVPRIGVDTINVRLLLNVTNDELLQFVSNQNWTVTRDVNQFTLVFATNVIGAKIIVPRLHGTDFVSANNMETQTLKSTDITTVNIEATEFIQLNFN